VVLHSKIYHLNNETTNIETMLMFIRNALLEKWSILELTLKPTLTGKTTITCRVVRSLGTTKWTEYRTNLWFVKHTLLTLTAFILSIFSFTRSLREIFSLFRLRIYLVSEKNSLVSKNYINHKIHIYQ
jgi:hypothetical protein